MKVTLEKKTHGADHKQGFLSGKALEYNLSGKEDHYTPILNLTLILPPVEP